MPRLFFGIPLPDPLREPVMELSRELRRTELRASWVPAENLHFTLKFLGDLPAERTEPLVNAAREAVAGVPAFSITLARLGAFPGVRRPRVLWVGGDPSSVAAVELGRRLDAIAVAFGVPAEQRPLALHMTLARVRPEARVPGSLAALLDRGKQLSLGSFSCRGATLFESTIGGGPARYTARACLELG